MKLLVAEIEGRQQAQDGAVGAVDEQLPLQALVDDGIALDGQLDSDHRSHDADVLDKRATLPERLEAILEGGADLNGTFEQPVLFDGFDGGEGGAASQGITAEGCGMRSGDQLLGDRWPGK